MNSMTRRKISGVALWSLFLCVFIAASETAYPLSSDTVAIKVRVSATDTNPPVTSGNYDGLWHTSNFVITLTAFDAQSGVKETYYKVNGGTQQIVSSAGHPQITQEGASNTVEYWSVDNANNEELPHKTLNGIKLDKSNPLVSISYPVIRTEGSGKVVYVSENHAYLAGNVSDSLSGPASADISVSGINVPSNMAPGGNFSSDRFSVTDGPTNIVVTGYDISGNLNSMALKMFLTVPVSAADLDGQNKAAAIVNFGPSYGIWAYKNNIWASIHPMSPKIFGAGNLDSDPKRELIADFGAVYGIYILYNNATWFFLHTATSNNIITADIDGDGKGEVIIDFDQNQGIWAYNPASKVWTFIHNLSPKHMAAGNIDGNGKKDLIINFGAAYGTWIRYDNGSWGFLHAASPETFITGDINKDGKDEIIINFGLSSGIWIYYPATGAFSHIHGIAPDSMVAGDINGDGNKDIIIDFGPSFGIWSFSGGNWSSVHSTSPDCMAAGDMDNNGSDDLIIDFGTALGIWILQNGSSWMKINTTSP